MGNITGFLEHPRQERPHRPPAQRIRDFLELTEPLTEPQRARQAGRCMDCGVPFCQAGGIHRGQLLGCPLHNLIPEWNHMLYAGNLPHALSRLLKTAPFPEFTGRVCPAPCEAACSCGLVGGSVTIRDNELEIIEAAFDGGLMKPRTPAHRLDRRIAVVGSGPAGLAAAYWLNRRGHYIQVFEREARPGGLLTYGIPNMKLPWSVVARRVALMEAEGIRFQCGVRVGTQVPLEQLRREFDCVILACGAQKPRPVEFRGRAKGVHFALDYLRAVCRQQLGETDQAPTARGKQVVVIGNGNTAGDCIATALRQGARDVTQVVRRPAAAYGDAADYAQEEARAVLGRDIRLFETRVERVIPDDRGQLMAVELRSEDLVRTVPAQLLLIASGFSGTETENAAMAADPGVLTAGDMRMGASLVVHALADGARAAAKADRLLMGYTGLKAPIPVDVKEN